MAGVTTRSNTTLTSPSFQAEAQPLPPTQCFDTRHSTEPTHTHATGNARMYPEPLSPQTPYATSLHNRLLGPAARDVLLTRASSSSAARAAIVPPLGDPAPQPLFTPPTPTP